MPGDKDKRKEYVNLVNIETQLRDFDQKEILVEVLPEEGKAGEGFRVAKFQTVRLGGVFVQGGGYVGGKAGLPVEQKFKDANEVVQSAMGSDGVFAVKSTKPVDLADKQTATGTSGAPDITVEHKPADKKMWVEVVLSLKNVSHGSDIKPLVFLDDGTNETHLVGDATDEVVTIQNGKIVNIIPSRVQLVRPITDGSTLKITFPALVDTKTCDSILSYTEVNAHGE